MSKKRHKKCKTLPLPDEDLVHRSPKILSPSALSMLLPGVNGHVECYLDMVKALGRLALAMPYHYKVLNLKAQGYTLRDIALVTESNISRVFRTLRSLKLLISNIVHGNYPYDKLQGNSIGEPLSHMTGYQVISPPGAYYTPDLHSSEALGEGCYRKKRLSSK